MKRVKTITGSFFALIVTAEILLGGCGGAEPIEPFITETELPCGTGLLESPEIIEPEKSEYILINEYGDYIDLKEAVLIYQSVGSDIVILKPEEAWTLDSFFIRFDNHTYMTNSVGISYNALIEVGSQDVSAGRPSLPYHEYDFFKVSVGDTINSLTVEEAYIEYLYIPETSDVPFAIDFGVSFSGSINLNGHLSIADYNDGGYVPNAGDIIFYPNAEDWGDIPIFKELHENTSLREGVVLDNIYFYSDLSAVQLGNITDYADEIGFDTFPQDGSFVRASVTVEGLKMYNSQSRQPNSCYGKIINILLTD